LPKFELEEIAISPFQFVCFEFENLANFSGIFFQKKHDFEKKRVFQLERI